jgi:hypothetical protein
MEGKEHMNRDDIIRMAQEAGFEMDDSCVLEPSIVWYIVEGQLERFAALVAAAEREACEGLERELAASPAHFVTVAEWKAYKKGVQKYAEYIRARGQA